MEKKDNILIVDDVTSNLAVLTEMVKKAGYSARPVTSVTLAINAIKVCTPQLILLDVALPDVNGFEFCRMLKMNCTTKDIPVIFISALNSAADKIKGFQVGGVDYIAKPFELEEVTMRINTHMKIIKMQKELEGQNQRLHTAISDQITKIENEQKNILLTIQKILELMFPKRVVHMAKVAKYTKILAMSLQFTRKFENEIDESFINNIELASNIHDIGMIVISEDIRKRKGPLTSEEFEEIKSHCTKGAETLEYIYDKYSKNEFLKMAIDITSSHHERYDGTGYPNGLAGKDIPLAARITSVIDVYDILLRKTCYRNAFSREEAVDMIRQESGAAFDPDIVDVFLKIQKKLR